MPSSQLFADSPILGVRDVELSAADDVRTHREKLARIEKMRMKTTAELIHYAVRNKLVDYRLVLTPPLTEAE